MELAMVLQPRQSIEELKSICGISGFPIISVLLHELLIRDSLFRDTAR